MDAYSNTKKIITLPISANITNDEKSENKTHRYLKLPRATSVSRNVCLTAIIVSGTDTPCEAQKQRLGVAELILILSASEVSGTSV